MGGSFTFPGRVMHCRGPENSGLAGLLRKGNMASVSHRPDKSLLGLKRTENILVFQRARQHFQVTWMAWSRCGVVEMRNGLVLGLALGLAVIAAPGAYAFQEQKSGGGQPAEAQAPAVAEPSAEKPLGLSGDTMTTKDEGTEIRIPGLGKLGVLPKMDFGLELLYGAAEQKQPAGVPEGGPVPEDDLMIRGTVKHRF